MLKSIAEDDTTTKVIILQMKNARDIDATACLALQHLFEYLKASDKVLIACGIPHQIWETLCDSGVAKLMGKQNLFVFDEHQPYLSIKKALIRATEIVGQEEAGNHNWSKVLPDDSKEEKISITIEPLSHLSQ